MAFDFSAVSAPFRMQPGLRRLVPGALQLTPNRLGDRALHDKLTVLTQHADQALLAVPDFDALPALRTLSGHATAQHPEAFAWDGDSTWQATHLGWSLHGEELCGEGPAEIGVCLRALPCEWRPVALLTLAFAEDFAVIDAATGCIPWLAVCLPSHWAPEEKLGQHFTAVHAPVADNQTLIKASESLVRLVTGDAHWERFVWTITPHPLLGQHPKRGPRVRWSALHSVDELAAHAFFRTERQTFIPIPGRQQAIFSIHVESRPLAAAVVSHQQARQVHDALASMSAAVLAYRGLGDARDRLLTWLDERAAPAAD